MKDRIEILSTDLLSTHSKLVNELEEIAHYIGVSTGWHYHMDWAWILSTLGNIKGTKILDAGAGIGVLQWYLAEQGFDVISVDRTNRSCLPFHIRNRYSVKGLRPIDLISPSQILNPFSPNIHFMDKIKCIIRSVLGFMRKSKKGPFSGRINIYNQDLRKLSDIHDNSIDAIISVSALEHNKPEDLFLVVKELERVLKPGGIMVITLAAARDIDWYHEPSNGWCYSESTLKKLFSLSPSTTSNYFKYYELFSALKMDKYLPSHLAKVYYRSNKLGMPNGNWNPQYQPVGVIKEKI